MRGAIIEVYKILTSNLRHGIKKKKESRSHDSDEQHEVININ